MTLAWNNLQCRATPKHIFDGLHEVYESIQRALNTKRGSQGNFKSITERARFHNHLAWKTLVGLCVNENIYVKRTTLGNIKIVHTPGFVTKKYKFARSAQELTFDTGAHLVVLRGALGEMVGYGSGGVRPSLKEKEIRIMPGSRINAIHPGHSIYKDQKIVLAHDGRSLRVKCTYMKHVVQRNGNYFESTGLSHLDAVLSFFHSSLVPDANDGDDKNEHLNNDELTNNEEEVIIVDDEEDDGTIEEAGQFNNTPRVVSGRETISVKIGDYFKYKDESSCAYVYIVHTIDVVNNVLIAKVRTPISLRGTEKQFSMFDTQIELGAPRWMM